MEECGVCEDCIDVCMEEAISKKAFTGLIEVISQGKCQILVLPRPLEQLQIRMVWSLLPVAK